MKLKQRILILAVVSSFVLLSMTCILFYTQTYLSDVVHVADTPSTLGAIARIKAELHKKDQIRPLKRKLSKKVAFTPSNFSFYDSNRAAEQELNETEYEELLKSGNLLSRNPGRSVTAYSKISSEGKGGPFPTVVPDCAEEHHFQGSREKPAVFPDLLQFVPKKKDTFGLYTKKMRVTLQEVHGISSADNLTYLDKFHIGISDIDLYAEDDRNVEALLLNMANLPIVYVDEKEGGTQLKLILTFQDGSQALFKPMRFDRNKETEPNHFYFVDYERHTSEIAAFHLDRILGFRRCPPVVGRRLNITTEIYAVAEDELIKTFFISPAQNICFHGTCSYYCDTSHAICGYPDLIEGSLAAFLPPDSLSGRKSWKNPWKRSYHKRRKAEFEKNPQYCDIVREQRPLYKNSKRLADLVDTHILDFLIGNMDRHHYETFKVFGNDSLILHLDHGRGFGRPNHDELSILAPLYQCCFVSFSTFERLLQIQHGPSRLSSLMNCSLSQDPLFPILLQKHLKALDRRLEIILRVIKGCLQTHDSKDVFFRESFV